MIRILTKIKSTKFWYIIILIIIKPLFSLIWLNIINFKSRQIFLKYCSTHKLRKNKIFTKNDKKITKIIKSQHLCMSLNYLTTGKASQRNSDSFGTKKH